MMETRTIPRPVELSVMAKAVPAFYKGYPCSWIDASLKLEKGTAKDAVMLYWHNKDYHGKIPL